MNDPVVLTVPAVTLSPAIIANTSITDFPPNSGMISGCTMLTLPSHARASPQDSR